jgi:hypothetical protein
MQQLQVKLLKCDKSYALYLCVTWRLLFLCLQHLCQLSCPYHLLHQHQPAPAAAAAAAAAPRLGSRFRRQEIVQRQQEHWRRHGRQQLQHVSQLQLQLRKEAVMSFCCCMAIEACLSWKQMAKVCCVCLFACLCV